MSFGSADLLHSMKIYDLYRWLRPKNSQYEHGTQINMFLRQIVTFGAAVSTAVDEPRSIGGSRDHHGLKLAKID